MTQSVGASNEDEVFWWHVREQFRTSDAWVEQIANVLVGLCRFLLLWSTSSVLGVVGILLLCVAYVDASVLDNPQEALRMVFPLVGWSVAALCIFANVGNFRFVFMDRASRAQSGTASGSRLTSLPIDTRRN